MNTASVEFFDEHIQIDLPAIPKLSGNYYIKNIKNGFLKNTIKASKLNFLEELAFMIILFGV